MLRVRAPLRIGLAGGGTDVPPFTINYGGCVLNTTIDKYAYAFLEETQDELIQFINQDLNNDQVYKLSEFKKIKEDKTLIAAVYSYFCKEYNKNEPVALRIQTFCEVPMGSGLGSSSTLVVAICELFNRFFNCGLNKFEITNISFKIEREILGFAGGFQDYYSATFGGFNFMEFGPENNLKIEALDLEKDFCLELESSMILAFTGQSRVSSKIIENQQHKIIEDSKNTISSLLTMKKQAYEMKKILLSGDLHLFKKLINLGWENKKKTSDLITNRKLDSLIASCFNSGAEACKISGAGGGGFMIIITKPEKRFSINNILKLNNIMTMNFTFTEKGSTIWETN
tara:strand:+ start:168 stop:1193 length:1026 start_codon:yes stop_codon:yes gene_type:complete